jgi:hypothetical protein
MSHDIHKGSPRQILQDGCRECEQRAKDVHVAIAHLDTKMFAFAWHRAAAWQQHGGGDISNAEAPLLRALWAVQVQLEQRGFPIGQVPSW